MKLFTRQGTCHSVTVYTYKNLNIKILTMYEREKERGGRDYVKEPAMLLSETVENHHSQKDCLHKVSVDQRMKTLIHIK